jgi:hypothetical protein
VEGLVDFPQIARTVGSMTQTLVIVDTILLVVILIVLLVGWRR